MHLAAFSSSAINLDAIIGNWMIVIIYPSNMKKQILYILFIFCLQFYLTCVVLLDNRFLIFSSMF